MFYYVDLCVFVIWNRVRNELSFWLTFFPESVARVPVSLWGFGQPFAHVRTRSQPFARARYGRAYGKFCNRGHFWRFHMSRSLVSRGRRGTSLHSDVFRNVSKVVLRGRRNTVEMFSEDEFQFSWQAQHFRLVVLRVFANLIVRAASSGDKVQIPWQAWQFVRCAENWRKLRTKHRFWGGKFWGSQQNS